jgi:hypothetical protein
LQSHPIRGSGRTYIDSYKPPPTETIVKTAAIRIHSIRPASGRALVCVALCDGLGMLPPQWLDQCPNPVQALQANLWDCAYEDQVSPGGGSA